MISSYLHALYANCVSLRRNAGYSPIQTETFFKEKIDQVCLRHQFQNEEDLVQSLLSTKYDDLKRFLEENPLLWIFYLVNSLGEYKASKENFDELGRFTYANSVQARTEITENLVWTLIKRSIREESHLASAFSIHNQKSLFSLSHDIDSLYGSTLQDGLWALKHKRFDVMVKLFMNVITTRPHWFNIDLIMELESEYDFRSTFYWLVNKGKIDKRQTNSDYAIGSQKMASQLKKIQNMGFENGLHKSISNETLLQEKEKLHVDVKGNRYHYLKYKLPEIYDKISESGFKLDASLGFAEHYGFRNNYGYPFSPYNFNTKTHYQFVECPLNVMDGTFQRYLKVPVHQTAETIITFLEKNKENCLISVLWHNTFFTNYKYRGYKQEYIKILKYFHDQKFSNINQTGIIEKFTWKK